MTQNQAPAITTEHLEALRAFADTIQSEAYTEPSGPTSRRAQRLFGTLVFGSIGYLSASLNNRPSWHESDDRRWWLLLQVVDVYKDRPDFPESIRPFLDTSE